MTRATQVVIVLAALTLAAQGVARAEDGTGTVTYVNAWHELSKGPNGVKVRRSHSRSVILADDPAVPFHMATQDCIGAAVIAADGHEVMDSGSCDAIDRDGDAWSLWYRNDAAGRVWQVIGGTGKYATMSGGGTTELLVQTPDGRATIRWTGSWQR